MSKSVLLKSSIAKKYWMALTGLFLCTFLIGHLLGNLQLFSGGEEGRRAFNEYGYFMTHNIFIKILSYTTYVSILFHAIDGLMLAVQNKKARPIGYASNKPSANSSFASRNMALLGTLILLFIIGHMANFWWKIKYSSDAPPMHTVTHSMDIQVGVNQMTGQPEMGQVDIDYYLTTAGEYLPQSHPLAEQLSLSGAQDLLKNVSEIKDHTHLYNEKGLKIGEGYKDMYSIVYAFFGHDINGIEANKYALIAVVLYVLAMAVLSFHLIHGFGSAFQSLGMRHPKYTKLINGVGLFFAIVVPMAFASIPVYIFSTI